MKIRWHISRVLAVAAVLSVAALSTAPALAADFRSGDNLTLSGETGLAGNIYAAARIFSVSVPVAGDLFAAGGNVNLLGQVSQDAMLAGGTVITTGEVLEDLRVAGGNVNVNSVVGGELLAAGGQVNILPQTQVAGDAAIAGGTVMWNGSTGGDLIIRGSEVHVDGPVAGNLDVYADKITLGPNAAIEGSFNYRAPQAAVMEEGAAIAGETNFSQVARRADKDKRKSAGGFVAAAFSWWLIKLVAVFLTALVLYRLFGRRRDEFLAPAANSFWREAGIGFAGLVLTPIAAVIAIATVVGAILGIVTLLGYGMILLLLAPIGSLIIGSWLARKIYKNNGNSGTRQNGKAGRNVAMAEMPWQMVFLGALIWQLLKLVPVLGWIVLFILALAAFGLVIDFKMRVLKEFAGNGRKAAAAKQ